MIQHLPLFARCAIETWTSYGDRSLSRLDGLLEHFATVQAMREALTPELHADIRAHVAKYL
jgi:hypothetical protein